MATRLKSKTNILEALFPDFSRGAGAFDHVPGFYAIALDSDERWGVAMPGPREVVARIGIASGYRV